VQEQTLINNNLLLKVSLTSKMLDRNTKMVLLLPEWCGGGTRDAPVIAQLAKEREILL
jgi:hypothetical protein